MGDKIIEGDEEVVFADTGAKPDTLEQAVVSPAPTEVKTEEIDNNASLMGNLLVQMWTYLNANQNIQATRFGVKAADYTPFLRFKYEGKCKSTIQARPLTREEYLSVLKQTTPELGVMLEGTDLKELLPLKSIQIYDLNNYNPVLASLGLGTEAGCKAIVDLLKCSREFTYIPDLETLSLFLANGAQLREYLRVNDTLQAQVTSSNGMFKVEKCAGESILTVQTNFPRTEQLFAPDFVLKYVQQTGTTNVQEMLVEYETVNAGIKNQIQLGNYVTTKIANVLRYLYELLEKNNPALILK